MAVYLVKNLNKKFFAKNAIYIVDKKIRNLKSLSMIPKERTVLVQAGEELKTLKSLEAVLKDIIGFSEDIAKNEIELVGVGGGSVTDFVGFVASIYKRGVKLSLVPTTWLAAIDSSHGGKTALNFETTKNQIGTFYPAHSIYLVKDILEGQPQMRSLEAWGEVLKTGMLSGGNLFSLIQKRQPEDSPWDILKLLVDFKYKIVKKDPFETKGIRQLLNLGHTVAHLFEIENEVPHGLAVWLGLYISVKQSLKKNPKSKKLKQFEKVVIREIPVFSPLRISRKKALSILNKDKKSLGKSLVSEVLFSSNGKPKIVKIRTDKILNVLVEEGLIG